MSNSDSGGAMIALLWIITIAISITTGILAWNWIEPDNFWGAIGFIVIWGILSKIGHFIAVAIAAMFSGSNQATLYFSILFRFMNFIF